MSRDGPKLAPAGDLTQAQLRLLDVAVEVAQEEAFEAHALGFQTRSVVLATLPYSDPRTNEFSRSNGRFRLSLLAPSGVGLPYGRYPRLLMGWLTTEAVRTRRRRLYLGPTLTGFMSNLGLLPSGGSTGTAPRLLDQMRRLFVCTFHLSHERFSARESRRQDRKFSVADANDLVFRPGAATLAWQSSVDLNPGFFAEVTERPVPIDLRILRALRSPLAIDIYCWLTYRFSFLSRPLEVPWEALHFQFGVQRARTSDFKKDFLAKLATVTRLYRDARVEEGRHGLLLLPSRPSVRARPFGSR